MEALLLVPVILFVAIFPLVALIDILVNEFTGYNKLAWVLVVLFFPFLGAILYFLLGRKQKIRRYRQKPILYRSSRL